MKRRGMRFLRVYAALAIAVLLPAVAQARDVMICEAPSDRAIQRLNSELLFETTSGTQRRVAGGLAQLYAEGWRLVQLVPYAERVRAYMEHD